VGLCVYKAVTPNNECVHFCVQPVYIFVHFRFVQCTIRFVQCTTERHHYSKSKTISALQQFEHPHEIKLKMSDEISRLVINAVTEAVAPLKAQVSQRGIRIKKQAAQIAQQDTQLAQLGTRIAQQGIRIAQQGTQIVQQEACISQQVAKIAQQDTQIAQHSSLIAQQGTQIALQGTRIAQQGIQIAQQDARLAQQDTLIAQQDTRIARLKNTATENEESYKQEMNLLIPEQISDLSNQILLFSCGDQPPKTTSQPAIYFGGLEGARYRQFHDEFNQQQDGSGILRSTEEWTAKFDNQIHASNTKIHFRDWDALERKVMNLRRFLERYPHLTAEQEDEVFVINSFEKIRNFPLPEVSAEEVRTRALKPMCQINESCP